jgi:hypothetical protein
MSSIGMQNHKELEVKYQIDSMNKQYKIDNIPNDYKLKINNKVKLKEPKKILKKKQDLTLLLIMTDFFGNSYSISIC